MKAFYLCMALTTTIGFIGGRATVKEPVYYLTADIVFEQGACKETTQIVNGEIQSKEWFAVDSSRRLYFSSFHWPNQIGCEDFYKMFGKKP